MAIRFACPNCSSVFTVADDAAGKRAKCNKCGSALTVPAGSQSSGRPTAPTPPHDAFDGGVTMRPRQPLRAQSLAPGGDEFDMGATLAPRRPSSPPVHDDFDHGATMPRAKPDTAGSHAQADTHQDRAATETASDLPLGSEVDGRYLVVSKLGQGGIGAVYKVVDKDTQTEFALKVLAADLVGSPEAVADLKKKVAIAQQLTHQNLLRVNYLGCTPQLTYLLMEYIDGEDLETYRLRHGGRIAANDFRTLMPQLVQGLEYLHNKGIVHLDIKPRNIMVSKTGELKLTDFGVSRSIKEQVSRRNQEQDLAGTLCFMAPEQIRKQVCDRRADIYAMGVVFCQLLTGRLPFATSDPKAIAAWHLGPDLDPAKLPAEWRELLRRCLARDPAKRFGTCKEMLPFFKGSSSANAPGDIFGDASSPAEQQFRRAVAQVFAKGEPTPQQREALRSLVQQLGLSADTAKQIIEEQRTGKAATGSATKETENLRILLEAGQYKDAAALGTQILAHDAQNALAWAAKGSEAADIHEMLKCFEMADRFGPNDPSVAKEKLRLARHHFEIASRQFDLFARLDYNAERHNSSASEFLCAAGAAVALAPNLVSEVMQMVVEACTGAIEKCGWYFNTSALKEIFGDRIVSRYFTEAAAKPGCAEPTAFAEKRNASGDGHSGTVISREQFPPIPQRKPTSGVVIAVVSGLFFGAGMGLFAAFKQGPEAGVGAALFCGLFFGPIMGFILRGIRIVVACPDRDQLAGFVSGLLVGMKYELVQESRGCLEFQHTNGGMIPSYYAVSVYFQTGTAVIVGPAWYVKKLKRRLPKAPANTTASVRRGPSLRELAGRALRKSASGILAIDRWLGRKLGEENALLHKFLRVLLIGIACVIGIWLLTLAWQLAGSVKAHLTRPNTADTPSEASGLGGTPKPRPADPNDPRNLIIGKWQFVEGGGGKGEAYKTFGTDGMMEFNMVDANMRAKWNYEFVDDTHIRQSYRKPATGELKAWTERIGVTKDQLIIFDPEEGDRRWKRVFENGRQDHSPAAEQHRDVTHFQAAEQHRDATRFDKAINEYDQAIASEPSAAAYRGRAICYFGKKDFKRAIADSSKAIELDPKDVVAYATRGRARIQSDPDQAIADCTEAIRLDPNCALAYRVRGGVYLQKDNYDQAVNDEDKAIQINPKDAKAFWLRASANSAKHKSEQASSDYAEAIRLDTDAIKADPENCVAYEGRAWSYYSQERFDEVIQDCDAVIRLNPSNEDAYLLRARAHQERGHSAEAIDDCTKAISLKPDDSLAYLIRGLAYKKKGLTSQAQSDFAHASALGEPTGALGVLASAPDKTASPSVRSTGNSDQDQVSACVRNMIASVEQGDVTARRAMVDLLAAIQCNAEFQSVSRIEVLGIERESEKLQAEDGRLVYVFDVTLRVSGKSRDSQDISCDVVHLAYPDAQGNWRLRCMDESVVRSWEQQLRQQRESNSPNRQPRSRSRQPTKSDKRQKTASGPEDIEAVAANRLKLAKSLLQQNSDAGKTRLRDIVEKYPGTKAATEAQETLDELPK